MRASNTREISAPVSDMALDSSLNYLVGDWTDETRTGEPGTANAGGESWRVDMGGRILIRMGWCEFPASATRAAFRHEDLLIIYPEGDDAMRGIFWDNEATRSTTPT